MQAERLGDEQLDELPNPSFRYGDHSSPCNRSPKGQINSESRPICYFPCLVGAQFSTSFVSREDFSAAVSRLHNQLSEVITGLEHLGCKCRCSPSLPFFRDDEALEENPHEEKEAFGDQESSVDEPFHRESQSLGLSDTLRSASAKKLTLGF